MAGIVLIVFLRGIELVRVTIGLRIGAHGFHALLAAIRYRTLKLRYLLFQSAYLTVGDGVLMPEDDEFLIHLLQLSASLTFIIVILSQFLIQPFNM